MRTARLALHFVAGLCLSSFGAAAALLPGGEQEDSFLPVDGAFRLEAPEQQGTEIVLRWQIAPDYYLYRHALRVRLPDHPEIRLGEPVIPEGKHKHDEYFGDVQTYRDALRISVPVTSALPNAADVVVEIRYQGCADAGLCYPPQTRRLPLTLTPAGIAGTPEAPAVTSAPAAPQEEQLASKLEQQSLPWVLLQFAGLGLLLAFTPCVLPMLPILGGVIAGSEARGALRGLTLAFAYVLAMALAYTLFGVVAALAGQNLQAALQAPAVILGFAAVFVALSLSMFGLYELRLPSALQTRLSQLSARQRGGSLWGAAVMGFVGALIIGPCVAPPLAGALLYIARTGDPLTGGAALFAMGFGMGLPLLALGAFEGQILPRGGAWMRRVNHLFGFVMLGVAIWLAQRVLPAPLALGLWAVLAYASASYLALQQTPHRGRRYGLLTLAFAAASYGAILGLGALHGGRDALHPLPRLSAAQPSGLPFTTVKTVEDLERSLREAQAAGQVAVLDFYADWCVACQILEHEIFPQPDVQAELNQLLRLRADVTAYDAEDKRLLNQFLLAGPPALLFFRDGQELKSQRLLGEPSAAELAAHLQRARAP